MRYWLDRRRVAPVLDKMQSALLTRSAEACARRSSLNESSICKIHRAIIGRKHGGRYRQREVWLLNRRTRRVCSAPPWEDVPNLMRRLGGWLRTTRGEPPIIVAALAHLELVAIHPFHDGNGRTARALACRMLAQSGVGLGRVSLETLLGKRDRRAYCEAIEAALGQDYTPGYDATPFVVYFIDALSTVFGRREGG